MSYKQILNNSMFIRICIILSLGVFILTGCDPVFRYEGEHIDLAATAIFSLPGVESGSDDQFLLLEQDQYGRKLYAAILKRSHLIQNSYNDCILALIVMQKSDNTNAYFYAEQNYLLSILSSKKTMLDEHLIDQIFITDDISNLKAANDWGKDPAACNQLFTAVPLLIEKEYTISRQSKLLISQAIGTNYRYVFFRHIDSGDVYFVLNIAEKESSTAYEWYLILLDQSGAFPTEGAGIVKLDSKNLNALSESVRAFLDKNR